MSVDYVCDVPLDTAATITGYWHDRAVEDDFFRNLSRARPRKCGDKIEAFRYLKWPT